MKSQQNIIGVPKIRNRFGTLCDRKYCYPSPLCLIFCFVLYIIGSLIHGFFFIALCKVIALPSIAIARRTMTIEKNKGKKQRNYTKNEVKKKKSDNFKRSNREKCNIALCYHNIGKINIKKQ